MLNRGYHTLNTKYNVLFNGNEAFEVGKAILEQAHDKRVAGRKSVGSVKNKQIIVISSSIFTKIYQIRHESLFFLPS